MKRVSFNKKLIRKLYVAQATEFKPAPREAVVNIVKSILKEKQFKKLLKHIDRISITKSIKSSGWVTRGRVRTDPKTGKVTYKIFDNSYFMVSNYKGVTVHELAHIDWTVKEKYHNEAWTKFNKTVFKLDPLNSYMRQNEAKWKKQQRLTSVQYCNEMHSALAELYYGSTAIDDRWTTNEEDKNIGLVAYRELHGLN